MERYYNLSDVNTKGLSKIIGKELKKEDFCNYTVKLTTFRKVYFLYYYYYYYCPDARLRPGLVCAEQTLCHSVLSFIL